MSGAAAAVDHSARRAGGGRLVCFVGHRVIDLTTLLGATKSPWRFNAGGWLQIIDRAELGKLRIHDLRHTFASHAAMNKETLPMIGRLLGHANHQSTARYAHLDDVHLLDAAQQVGDVIESLFA